MLDDIDICIKQEAHALRVHHHCCLSGKGKQRAGVINKFGYNWKLFHSDVHIHKDKK